MAKSKFVYYEIRNGSREENSEAQEIFAEQGLRNAAIENGQNAGDVRRDVNMPVITTWSDFKVPQEEIPDVEGLKENIRKQLNLVREDDPPKEKLVQLAESALENIDQEEVSILSCSDQNTTGLTGPYDSDQGSYRAYLRGKGRSVKSVENPGGSRGMGKAAFTLCSTSRTVFVSTNYEDDNGEVQSLYEGKTELLSMRYAKNPNNFTDRLAFCGQPDNKPMLEEEVPSWMKRSKDFPDNPKELGTTFFAVGFAEPKNWELELLTGIITKLYGQIAEGRQVFRIKSQNGFDEEINQSNLLDWFSNVELRKHVGEGQLDEFETNAYMAFLYSAEPGKQPFTLDGKTRTFDVKVEEVEVKELGKVKITFMEGEGLPKKVGIFRSGIKVTHELSIKRTGLKQFRPYTDFVAVVKAEERIGNGLLQNMEDAKHDKFIWQVDSSERETKIRKRALKDLIAQVRAVLQKHLMENVEGETRLDELADLFKAEKDPQIGELASTEIDLAGKTVLGTTRILRDTPEPTQQQEEIEEDVLAKIYGKNKRGKLKNREDTKPLVPVKGKVQADVVTVKDPCCPRDDRGKGILSFESGGTGEVSLVLKVQGAEGKGEKVEILDFDSTTEWKGKAGGNLISGLHVEKGQRVALPLQLSCDPYEAIKVTAIQVTKVAT